ncbi:hypothetical protein CZ771_00665 [Actinomycetales bacterium JB111]|nr:hypothetical protein CZ771_00665 [Actinomycetales bacterium JB111]
MSTHTTDAPAARRRTDRPRRPGRTIIVSIGALVLLLSAVLPGLAYVQARADGRPIEIQGGAAASTVSIDAERASVTLLPSDDDEVTWDVTGGTATADADVQVDGDSVAIEVGDVRGSWGGSSFSDWGPSDLPFLDGASRTPQVTVSVPAGTDVDVELDMGRLRGEGIDVANLSVDSHLGDVELTGAAENLTATMDLGDFRASDLAVTGAMTLTSSLGNFDLASSSVPGSIEVDSDLGDVTLALPPGPYRVSTRTDLGEVVNRLTVVDGETSVPVDLSTGLGRIMLTDY